MLISGHIVKNLLFKRLLRSLDEKRVLMFYPISYINADID